MQAGEGLTRSDHAAIQRRRCCRCGYDLSGHATMDRRCPECGSSEDSGKSWFCRSPVREWRRPPSAAFKQLDPSVCLRREVRRWVIAFAAPGLAVALLLLLGAALPRVAGGVEIFPFRAAIQFAWARSPAAPINLRPPILCSVDAIVAAAILAHGASIAALAFGFSLAATSIARFRSPAPGHPVQRAVILSSLFAPAVSAAAGCALLPQLLHLVLHLASPTGASLGSLLQMRTWIAATAASGAFSVYWGTILSMKLAEFAGGLPRRSSVSFAVQTLWLVAVSVTSLGWCVRLAFP